jgi:broad specificity phosphatase PhoE
MQKEIYIIRHGETDYNRFGMVQGSGIDSVLNDKGQNQAELFYDAYRGLAFDKVYVSALQRTHESVTHFTNHGIASEAYSGLNEISWGSHEGKVASGLDKEYYSWLIREWKTGNTQIRIREGESPDEVARRQQKVLNIISSRVNEKRILVCMHGRAMRIFLCLLLNLPLSEMDRFNHENLCLYVVRMNKDGVYELVKENCTRHLGMMEEVMRA